VPDRAGRRRRIGDRTGKAHAVLLLALAQVRSGRLRDAAPHFDRALRMLEATAAITAAR